jgi:hypothetical protein
VQETDIAVTGGWITGLTAVTGFIFLVVYTLANKNRHRFIPAFGLKGVFKESFVS